MTDERKACCCGETGARAAEGRGPLGPVLPMAHDAPPTGTDQGACGCGDAARPPEGAQADDVCCCGGPPDPPADPAERPGYAINPFVERFLETPAGPVPVVSTRLAVRDRLGTLLARLGLCRAAYRVAPGLYAVGAPGPESPVLVGADYKLSFDSLRRELGGVDEIGRAHV